MPYTIKNACFLESTPIPSSPLQHGLPLPLHCRVLLLVPQRLELPHVLHVALVEIPLLRGQGAIAVRLELGQLGRVAGDLTACMSVGWGMGGGISPPPQAPISYLVTYELFETLMYCVPPPTTQTQAHLCLRLAHVGFRRVYAMVLSPFYCPPHMGSAKISAGG